MKSKYIWNLGLLYKSPEDPKIEEDIKKIERASNTFAQKYNVDSKNYISDNTLLLQALEEYEKLMLLNYESRPITYFSCLRDIDAKSVVAVSKLSLLQDRLTKANNQVLFFELTLGLIDENRQEDILKNQSFAKYRYFLDVIFNNAKYDLSLPEEKILKLKSLPAYDMWITMNQRILNNVEVKWKGKNIPFSTAFSKSLSLPKSKDRMELSSKINEALKVVAPVAEAEINAVVTSKKINDELRGYKTPEEATILRYQNKPETINSLVESVSSNYHIAHKFYSLKAKILKEKRLNYCDRGIPIGKIKRKFDFKQSFDILEKVFGDIKPAYADILKSYVNKGQIDSHSRVGKQSGAYCRSSYEEPTYILLNHEDNLRSFKTFAHEMGHAFHTVHSRAQGPLYVSYSIALAETASTLFESLALEYVMKNLTPKEKKIVLHDKINSEISTIFRQIACFNYEKDIHEAIRRKGYISKEELMDMHNKRMSEYLGSKFKLNRDDGDMFISWSHIRRFFYVYSYAFGLLISKVLLKRYRIDKNFWSSIEIFLSAGGKDSPENIMKEIGIDITKPDFWLEGLKEIDSDIEKLEKLIVDKNN